jgi:hypothetical protein
MRMPGFTAEMGIGESATHYSGTHAFGPAGRGGQLRPAFVASPQCRTSSCVQVGRCMTKVRCCRSFSGKCTCQAVPCLFLGPADSA